MFIRKIHIQSYKGFADSGPLPLGRHTNVVVGPNSAGKSAFLEAFAFTTERLKNVPHRPASDPDFRRAQARSTTIEYHFRVSLAEVLEFIAATGEHLYLPWPQNNPNYQDILNRYGANALSASAVYVPRAGDFASSIVTLGKSRMIGPIDSVRVTISPEGGPPSLSLKRNNAGNVGTILWKMLTSRLFTFDAERYKIGRCALSTELTLRSDASNLPVCLLRLNANRAQFEEYVSLVRRILPQIEDVTISLPPDSGNEAEILVYNTKSNSAGAGVSLDACGSGVAQVLAIAFVLVTLPNAILVIDEPNSFLHPGAVKNLMRELRSRQDIQIILSTHSPEVISAIHPQKLLEVSWDSEIGTSQVRMIDGSAEETKRHLLNSLGVSFADVFGIDKLIWVEGATEVAAFDLVADHLALADRNAIAFVPMPWASKADKKDKNAVREFFEVHRRVSSPAALGPRIVRFSFDPETRKAGDKAEIVQLSENRAVFLPSRMYENYLLHPAALANLLGQLDSGGKHSSDGVEAALSQLLEGQDESTCDGANVLKQLFRQITENRFEYDKISHGRRLTSWLLANDAKHLSEVAEHVRALLSER